jgi:hypothetical protein
MGKRLAYELKCGSQHAEHSAAVTIVKFSAEHPYGKAVALLDTESEFITVHHSVLMSYIILSSQN